MSKGVVMDCKERLVAYLQAEGVDFEVHHHRQAFTAQEVAATEHISGKRLAKVVMVMAGADLVMTVLPAHERVDLDVLAGVTGATGLRLAEEDEFSSRFDDCEAGAQPPFGNLYGLPVYVDSALSQQERIEFRAGTHTDTIGIRYADFARLVQPAVDSFGRVEG
jgi:Ala-tRNA(Pro) deacylase